MCIPVEPDVFGYAVTPIASSTFFTSCAALITWSKCCLSGSRSITQKSGLSGEDTRLNHGLISIQPSEAIQRRLALFFATRYSFSTPSLVVCGIVDMQSGALSLTSFGGGAGPGGRGGGRGGGGGRAGGGAAM